MSALRNLKSLGIQGNFPYVDGIIGSSRALGLLWSSRKVGADESLRIGLLDRVVAADELLAECKAYIENLAANCSPTSIMMMKKQIYRHMNMDLHDAMVESNGWMDGWRRA